MNRESIFKKYPSVSRKSILKVISLLEFIANSDIYKVSIMIDNFEDNSHRLTFPQNTWLEGITLNQEEYTIYEALKGLPKITT